MNSAIPRFDERVTASFGKQLDAVSIDTFQVNIGLKCNQACKHCHVESNPSRTEAMDWETMERVIEAAKTSQARVIDITGGAPELHLHFKKFNTEIKRSLDCHVIVRTNLTVLLESEMESFPDFFVQNQVELVASLPCYLEENVDFQRGSGVFQKSIQAIQRLNQLGYGR